MSLSDAKDDLKRHPVNSTSTCYTNGSPVKYKPSDIYSSDTDTVTFQSYSEILQLFWGLIGTGIALVGIGLVIVLITGVSLYIVPRISDRYHEWKGTAYKKRLFKEYPTSYDTMI
jgi:hypothetical protein